MKSVEFVSLTSDGWTNLRRRPFVSITFHYITENWTLERECVDVFPLPEAHTGAAVSGAVLENIDQCLTEKTTIVAMAEPTSANHGK